MKIFSHVCTRSNENLIKIFKRILFQTTPQEFFSAMMRMRCKRNENEQKKMKTIEIHVLK